MSEVPDYFGKISAEYARKQYGPGARTFISVRHAAVLEEVDRLGLAPAAQVLDAGCGPGFLSRDLLDRGFDVRSMDLSEGMIEEARRNIGAQRARLSRGSIEQLPYGDAQFDLVCCCGVIEYLEDYERAAREFLRVLRPGGVLILPTTSAYAPANLLYPLVEAAKGVDLLRRAFHAPPKRDFAMHFHAPRRMRRRLEQVGFTVVRERYFFLLPMPRPLDKLLGPLARALERGLARFGRTPVLRRIGEGYLPVCRK